MPKTIRDLQTERLGVRTTPFVNRAASSIGTTTGQILRQDPSRVAFLFVNLSLNRIYLTPTGVPSSTRGIRVEPNGGNVSLLWQEDGEMVAWEWRGVADGAGSNFFVLEAIIAPEG